MLFNDNDKKTPPVRRQNIGQQSLQDNEIEERSQTEWVFLKLDVPRLRENPSGDKTEVTISYECLVFRYDPTLDTPLIYRSILEQFVNIAVL